MANFCKVYSMNTERRASLLRLLALNEDDHKIANILHTQVLDEQVGHIIDEFYEYLLQHSEYSTLIPEDLLPSLKKTQSSYMFSFGVGFDQSDYFENRLRVGLAHKRIGLSLGLYQCAYRQLQQIMLNGIPDDFMQEGVSGRDLCCFIHKITTLDMTLAIETYHDASVMDIQGELDVASVEKAELREQVRTDSLTGLFTRDYGLEMLKKHLLHDRGKKDICLIMADIDHFKVVNDTYGHLAGDEVLRQIAKLLNSAVRDFDTVCRFGGEEFMIVLSQTSPEIVMQVAERIRRLVSETVIQYAGEDIHITISQGVAVGQAESDAMQLLSVADEALYQAKDQGRDCVVMSGEGSIRA